MNTPKRIATLKVTKVPKSNGRFHRQACLNVPKDISDQFPDGQRFVVKFSKKHGIIFKPVDKKYFSFAPQKINLRDVAIIGGEPSL